MRLKLIEVKADKSVPGSEEAAEQVRQSLRAGTALPSGEMWVVVPAGVAIEVREIGSDSPPLPPPAPQPAPWWPAPSWPITSGGVTFGASSIVPKEQQ